MKKLLELEKQLKEYRELLDKADPALELKQEATKTRSPNKKPHLPAVTIAAEPDPVKRSENLKAAKARQQAKNDKKWQQTQAAEKAIAERVNKSLDERIDDLLKAQNLDPAMLKLALAQQQKEQAAAAKDEQKLKINREANKKFNEQSHGTTGLETPPAGPGSRHGETHVVDSPRGTRLINFPTDEVGTDGKPVMGKRHVVNNVRVTHQWDDNNKKWNYLHTKNAIPGLSAAGQPLSGLEGGMSASKPKMDEVIDRIKTRQEPKPEASTPMSLANQKMAAFEAEKNKPAVSVAPKTMLRKK